MADDEKVGCAICQALGIDLDAMGPEPKGHGHVRHVVKADPEYLVTRLFMGTPVDLGQKCPECPERHLCDAVCFRFSPRTFKCLGCNQYHRHKKMDTLIREYQMNELLKAQGN
jgi:hypothetical protein